MSAENKKRSPVFRILKAVGVFLLAVVVLFAGLLGFLSVTEYKPEDRTALSVEGTAGSSISEGDSLTIMTWNIGYGALGDNADFFMDGGKMVNTADKARVAENMQGIISALNTFAPDILEAEAEKGNYVIAGGDFNQIFSSADTNAYPAQPGKWAAGEIDVTSFPEGWQFLMGSSAPTCRSLDQPYAGADKESFQYYLIDGFIVSENVQVNSLATQDLGFVNSDHNPVLMMVTLS